MPLEEKNEGVEWAKVPKRSRMQFQKPYTLSGLAKFFMVIGAVFFLFFTVAFLISVFTPPTVTSTRFYGHVQVMSNRTSEYPESFKVSAVIFVIEAVIYAIMVMVALSINNQKHLGEAERVKQLTGIASAIIVFLGVFFITCIGVAIWTEGEVVMLPGGGTIALVFILLSEMKNWRLGHELTVAGKFKKARKKRIDKGQMIQPALAKNSAQLVTGKLVTDIKQDKDAVVTFGETRAPKSILESYKEKKGVNKKALIIVIVAVLTITLAYFLLDRTNKKHPAYLYAMAEIGRSRQTKRELGAYYLDEVAEGRITKWEEGEEDGFPSIEFENTIRGPLRGGYFKAKAVYYKGHWEILHLGVVLENGYSKKLVDAKITEEGVVDKDKQHYSW